MTGLAGRYDYPDMAGVRIDPPNEQQLAARLAQRGKRIVEFRGRYWLEAFPGFYDGLHWLSRRSIGEIGRPTWPCWGYRAALLDGEESFANCTIPIHLLSNLAEYTLESIPSKGMRYDLRVFDRQSDIRIVHVTDTRVLDDQSYDVMMSTRVRTRREAKAPPRERFLASAHRHAHDQGRLVVAGMTGDTLLGYMTSWSVGRTAYLHMLWVATEAMDSSLSAALYFETIQAFRRSGTVDEVCGGLHFPEKPSLGFFKERLGFTVARVPSRVLLWSPAAAYLRRTRPNQCYRLTGRPGPVG